MKAQRLIMLLNVILWFFLRPIVFYCDYILFEKGRVFRNPNAITQDTIMLVMEFVLLLGAMVFYIKYVFKKEDSIKAKVLKTGFFVILAVLFYITSSIITSIFYMFIYKSWM
jgi:hypothetical protein